MNSRRDFFKKAAIAGAGMIAIPTAVSSKIAEVKSQQAINLRFASNGKFKIIQVTDTHIKAVSNPTDSMVSVQMLNVVLDSEKPDLVVYTGDVVNERPYQTGLDMITKPVIDRKIPWVLALGNHDGEHDLSNPQIGALLNTYPYFAGKIVQDAHVSGTGNYVLELKSSRSNRTNALIYCMDSHSGDRINGKISTAWLKFDQIAWYRAQSERYTKANQGNPLPALAFFHIPMPEYNDNQSHNIYGKSVDGLPYIGVQNEAVCCADANSGMLLTMAEQGDVMGVFVGHDHVNDYIFNDMGIALAYGRFSGSKTTYGYDVMKINGVRVIELSENQDGIATHSFDTWIRLADNSVINKVRGPECVAF